MKRKGLAFSLLALGTTISSRPIARANDVLFPPVHHSADGVPSKLDELLGAKT